MTSRYEVTYALKAHRRDGFVDFIKSLLRTPFVLNIKSSGPTLGSLLDIGAMDKDDIGAALARTPSNARPSEASFGESHVTSPSPVGDDLLGPSAVAAIALNKAANRRRSYSPQPRTRDILERYAEIFSLMEQLIDEHRMYTERGSPQLSRLSQLVPSVGTFFTPLPLRAAFLYQNELRSISSRRHVTPSFNDIRHILNTAQTRAAASTLRLITFDGDMTLYDDGGEFPRDSRIGGLLSALLKRGVNVAIVTAAGYAGDEGVRRYEKRLEGLLEGLTKNGVGDGKGGTGRFFVFGGECNYLHTFTPLSGRLSYIPPSQYLPADISNPLSFSLHPSNTSRIAAFLDVVEQCLLETREEMNLKERTKVIRKERAVGVMPVEGTQKLTREQWDEFVLSVKERIAHFQHYEHLLTRKDARARTSSQSSDTSNNPSSVSPLPDLPFCAFNGGNDVWVDIGNKLIGVKILRSWLGIDGEETIHVGDQFLSTGNDISTRSACCTLWVADPKETEDALDELDVLLKKEELRRGAQSQGSRRVPT